MKRCHTCNKSKELKEFTKRSNTKDGHRTQCKECDKEYRKKNREVLKESNREYYRKNKAKWREQQYQETYGIGVAEYEDMLKDQGGMCKICGSRDSQNPCTEHFCIDHDHETGRVRGLLCDHCNHGLGKFGDSVELMKKAIKYLEE